jgi:hypothetical protein
MNWNNMEGCGRDLIWYTFPVLANKNWERPHGKGGYLTRSTARFGFLLSRLSSYPFCCFPFALLILFFCFL